MGDTARTGEHVSLDIEAQNSSLVHSMKEKLCHELPYDSEHCIFKVPEKLRSCNKKGYDPNVISIGPYHHGKPELDTIERIKYWYLQSLLLRFPVPPDETLALFVEDIRGLQSSARRCYAEKTGSELDGDRFVEMLIVDGCFLIELFRKDSWSIQPHKDDPIFKTLEDDPSLTALMLPNLYHDLILLENQIPWFILVRLFCLSEPAISRFCQEQDNDHVLAVLVLKFFETMMLMTEPVEYSKSSNKIKHILDLLHSCVLSKSATKRPEHKSWKVVPSVTDLLLSGVSFKKGNPGNILNIKFSKGVFEIPPIKLRGNAESLFQNLIAYEECNYFTNHHFTSYAVLLDCLVNTSTDAEFLCDVGIIGNALSSEDIALLFNRLYNDNLASQFYYGKLTHDVNKYYRSRWPRWRTTLMSKHFKNPWSIFSLVAAILILVFTFTQTLFSILAY